MGCLGWLSNTDHPDISYSPSRIGQHMAAPTKSAFSAIQRVLQYLQGSKDYCLRARLNGKETTAKDLLGETEEDLAPTKWSSKKSSVAFAHPLIGEAHADISSSAAEVYCAANATFDILALSYIVEEMGMDFKLPAILRMDNAAAEVFTNNTANKTRLKHIDCRQEWVKMLRNKSLVKPLHVPSEDNLADIFTKILDKPTFINLRDRLLHQKKLAAA